MLRPDYKEFARLAREATLVPVAKSVAADLLTPVSAFLAVAAKEPDACLLESVERGEQIGRFTFVGARPYMQIRARGHEITIQRGKRKQTFTGNVFEVLKEQLRKHRPASVPGLPPFTGGAVGYFAYDVVRNLENIGEHAKDDLSIPDCILMFLTACWPSITFAIKSISSPWRMSRAKARAAPTIAPPPISPCWK